MLSNLKKYHIILASKSPRRQELLRGMGEEFEILTKETPEDYPADLTLDEVPKFLSLQKSLAFADNELPADFLLITSDTVVICEGEILGKPKDREDAARMLQLLSGKTHHVVTGVTVRSVCGHQRIGRLVLQCDGSADAKTLPVLEGVLIWFINTNYQ